MSIDISFNRFLRISIFNLLLVAIAGVILRYKILYPLPFVNQKFLLHGHSHFAFSGWVTQTLMVLLVAYLAKKSNQNKFTSYKYLLIANLVTAYGMLIAFPIQGYAAVSITFSTLSIFVFYFFTYRFWKDLNKLTEQPIAHLWIKTGLALGVLSSLGTFGLAFMMATKNIHQDLYLASIYFYLHFQYNGWFFFACVGLLHTFLPVAMANNAQLKFVFKLFAIASVPAYLLSTLWIPMPSIVYFIVVLASIMQIVAWIIFVKLIYNAKHLLSEKISQVGRWLMGLSAIALTIKLVLQLASTIPVLGNLAFGFRSIIIAYLHLVLLGVISLFLIGYIYSVSKFPIVKLTLVGIVVFVLGVFLNELVLMLQGVASFSYSLIPYTNELLFGMALILFLGAFIILISTFKKAK